MFNSSILYLSQDFQRAFSFVWEHLMALCLLAWRGATETVWYELTDIKNSARRKQQEVTGAFSPCAERHNSNRTKGIFSSPHAQSNKYGPTVAYKSVAYVFLKNYGGFICIYKVYIDLLVNQTGYLKKKWKPFEAQLKIGASWLLSSVAPLCEMAFRRTTGHPSGRPRQQLHIPTAAVSLAPPFRYHSLQKPSGQSRQINVVRGCISLRNILHLLLLWWS